MAKAAPSFKSGAVVALAEPGIIEGGEKDFFDQLGGGPATGAVAHVDAAVAEIQRPNVALAHHAALAVVFRVHSDILNLPYA